MPGGAESGAVIWGSFAVVTGLPRPTPVAILTVLYLGAGCSAATYALWGYGLSHLPPGRVTLLGNLELVCGIVTTTTVALAAIG